MSPPRKTPSTAPTAEEPEAPEQTPPAEPEVPAAPEPEPPARHVLEAIQRVTRDLPAVGKDQESEQGYRYRGIEAITAHAGTLFGRHGVTFVPAVLEREVEPLTINNRPWTETRLKLLYRVYGPGGVDDVLEVGPIWTAGRDNSDKGYNKCMTQGFKYALLQVLCVGDKADDADAGEAAVADARQPDEDLADLAPKDAVDELVARIKALKDAGVEVEARGWNVRGVQLVVDRRIVVDAVTVEELLEWVAGLEAEAEARSVEEPAEGPESVEDASPAVEEPEPAADGEEAAPGPEGALFGCPHCGSPINEENPIRTWPREKTAEEAEADPDGPDPMVAGCAACEPM